MRKNRASFGQYCPDDCHEKALEKYLYHYEDFSSREEFIDVIGQKFLSVLGDMPSDFTPVCKEEYKVDKKTHWEIRLIIETEKDCFCPCLLLLPKGIKNPSVVICLQGHSNGMKLSVGEIYYPSDTLDVLEDRDYGLQAVKHGYAAMVVEQRGFGERKCKLHLKSKANCDFLAYNALLIGRTLIGERLWDIKQVIDVLETREDVDASKIGIMGNSGGGTASYYAACFDKRISCVMPSCSLCTYSESIGAMRHCPCNYLPSAAKYFDMGELSCLIYPRPIVVVSGKRDPIFPISGAQKTFSTMEKIYEEDKDKLYHYIGNGGHRFYEKAWDVFDKFMKG